MVAILGTIALALASHARAEGGEEPSLVSPDQAEAFAKASAAAEAPDPAAPAEPAAEKPAKASGRKTGKIASALPDAAAETQAVPGVEPAGPSNVKSRSRQADAVRAVALKPLIARHAAANGLPYELADAIIRLESRYNAGARNGPNMGLTQINVSTAQSLGYQGAAAGLLDAETNLRYGLKYLAGAYRLAGGDTCGTILRYQFGHRTQTMTGASRVYCAKVKVITAAAN
jgi:soluble lytic murein transglycosylase-like protein